jgi:hypothetical protein
MWQVLLGIYLIVMALSVVLLWSSLALAKRSDRNTKIGLQRMRSAIIRNEGELINNQPSKLPTLSH